jgi:hypothetical protein
MALKGLSSIVMEEVRDPVSTDVSYTVQEYNFQDPDHPKECTVPYPEYSHWMNTKDKKMWCLLTNNGKEAEWVLLCQWSQ